jgi:hypothetical protein
MDSNHAAAAVGVGLTIAGIIAGAAKFRPGLDRHARDTVDLAAYTLRGIGRAAALYDLLAVDATAWGVAVGGITLAPCFSRSSGARPARSTDSHTKPNASDIITKIIPSPRVSVMAEPAAFISNGRVWRILLAADHRCQVHS